MLREAVRMALNKGLWYWVSIRDPGSSLKNCFNAEVTAATSKFAMISSSGGSRRVLNKAINALILVPGPDFLYTPSISIPLASTTCTQIVTK